MPLTAIPDAPIKQPSVNLGNVSGSKWGQALTNQQGGIHGSKKSTKEIGEESTNEEGNSGKGTDDQVGYAGADRSEHGLGQETGRNDF
jgi:hypothetical protein